MRTQQETKEKILLFLKNESLEYFSIKQLCRELKLTRGAISSSVYDLERNEFLEGKLFSCYQGTGERKYKLSPLITHTFLN